MQVKFFVFFLFIFISIPFFCVAQKNEKKLFPIFFENGKLNYTPDSLGNKIIDFSFCGYTNQNNNIPYVPPIIVIPPIKGDMTAVLQNAINYVSTLNSSQKIDNTNFKGAIQLQKGVYHISKGLLINTNGIVIRGAGINETIIETNAIDRLPVFYIKGNNENMMYENIKIADAYFPIGSTQLKLEKQIFSPFDKITITRLATKKWINHLGCNEFGGGLSALGWKENDVNTTWHRTIKSVKDNTIEIYAPLADALDSNFGAAIISKSSLQPIEFCAIENLSIVSSFDKTNSKDEDHAWDAIRLENARNCWVRRTQIKHIAGSAVFVNKNSKNITVEDVKYVSPISEIGGGRRNAFATEGEFTLFQRCYADSAIHAFSVGHSTAGPNAFVQCEATNALGFSGAVSSWATGTLFDLVNVEGNAIRFGYRGQDANGAGWSAANSVLWNCSAALIENKKTPTANNFAFGSWAQFEGNGFWAESNNTITPRSLFYVQLEQRLQKKINNNLIPFDGEASSSPSVEVAAKLTKAALQPKMTLSNWIDELIKKDPIKLAPAKRTITSIDYFAADRATDVKLLNVPTLQVNKKGWLTFGNKIIIGNTQDIQWWSGGLSPKEKAQSKLHLTRYVPNQIGNGLTDDLTTIVDSLRQRKYIGIAHHYGLWYDRRRDDHQRVKRMDGDVWPPFYELPFARSGKEIAWDGLSKYDLTKYNKFYWSRLQQFANLADLNNLLLLNHHYFQHNIIEAGAHYADFPWRTANNINNTGFNEPVNYAGDKRIFYGEQFYDITNKNRNELHKKYIFQNLNNFKHNKNVIHYISEEYTGATHFVKFWLDNIALWEKENKLQVIIALSVTKDVQDSILAIKKYADMIDIIEIKYWHYEADGNLYAPKGGQNLAPRQHARLLKPKKTSDQQVYRAVYEYKTKYPTKAVVYRGDNYLAYSHAAFMAGGSLVPNIKKEYEEDLEQISNFSPIHKIDKMEWELSDGLKSSTGYNYKDGIYWKIYTK